MQKRLRASCEIWGNFDMQTIKSDLGKLWLTWHLVLRAPHSHLFILKFPRHVDVDGSPGWGGRVQHPMHTCLARLFLHPAVVGAAFQEPMSLTLTGWFVAKDNSIVFKTEVKVWSWFFVGPSHKGSSGASHRRGGVLCSTLGRVKQGQRLLFPHWASKPPDWCSPTDSLQGCEENWLQWLKAGRSPGFSSLLQNLHVHFLQRPFVAPEISPGDWRNVTVPWDSVVFIYTNQCYLCSWWECHPGFNPKGWGRAASEQQGMPPCHSGKEAD